MMRRRTTEWACASLASSLLFGCAWAGAPAEERSATATQAILGGRPSDDADDAVVRVEAVDATGAPTARCSGHAVAPNLVVTARHCALATAKVELHCLPDGTLANVGETSGQDTQTVAPDRLTVYVGADRDHAAPFHVRDVVVEYEIGLCKSDIAFLVLDGDAVSTTTPIRRGPVHVGERFRVSGWGYTADGQTTLPTVRSTLDDVRVDDVGPGLIPADSFAVAGDTVCFGDSGAAALVNGTTVGVYSRIEGPACSLPESRNVFTMVGAHLDLVERAFAAAGRTPSYDEPSAPAPAPTTEDEASPAPPRARAASCDFSAAPIGTREAPFAAGAAAAAVVMLLRRRRGAMEARRS